MEIHEQRQRHRADLVTLFTGASLNSYAWQKAGCSTARTARRLMGLMWWRRSTRRRRCSCMRLAIIRCSHATNDVAGLCTARLPIHMMKFGITTTEHYPMRTLMSYGMGRRLGYFSNPNASIWGVPTGDTNFANNAFTIQQMSPVVGSYFTEIIHHTQLVPNVQPISILPGTTIAPRSAAARDFLGTGSSYRRLPMHHKCCGCAETAGRLRRWGVVGEDAV